MSYISLPPYFVDPLCLRILSGCYDNSINIWTTKGTHVLTVSGHVGPVKAVSWISMDEHMGTFVSTSQDQTAMIWEWNIAKNVVTCIYVCKGHERGVDCVNVNPAGKLFATGGWDNMLKIWSTSNLPQSRCISFSYNLKCVHYRYRTRRFS